MRQQSDPLTGEYHQCNGAGKIAGMCIKAKEKGIIC